MPVGHRQDQERIMRFSGIARQQGCIVGALFFLLSAASRTGLARCTEKPTVWMSERTAASHLLSSHKFVFPAVAPMLAHIRSVVVVVTINRKGSVCEARAEAGPTELRAAAEKIARTYWRYRPFLLDRKPVVVQIPVTVNFVMSVDRKDRTTPDLATTRVSPMIPGTAPRFGLGTASL